MTNLTKLWYVDPKNKSNWLLTEVMVCAWYKTVLVSCVWIGQRQVIACKHKKYMKLTKSWWWNANNMWNGIKLVHRVSKIWQTWQSYGM